MDVVFNKKKGKFFRIQSKLTSSCARQSSLAYQVMEPECHCSILSVASQANSLNEAMSVSLYH